jgi:hypothetical protein
MDGAAGPAARRSNGEAFAGTPRFVCGGRCVWAGRDRAVLYTVGLIAVPSGLYFGFEYARWRRRQQQQRRQQQGGLGCDAPPPRPCLRHPPSAPYLWQHASPALPALALLLCITTLVMLAWTTFTDPGFLPRSRGGRDESQDLDGNGALRAWAALRAA